MRPTLLKPGPRGFTLVEVVVTMVVVAIIGTMLAVFIAQPVQAYRDTAARTELVDAADLVVRRMAREVRLALPNSVRVTSDGLTLEMLETRTGGRYLAVEDGQAATYPVLDFVNTSNKTFQFLGQVPTNREAISANDRIVVYNLGEGMEPVNAYSYQNAAQVTGVSGNIVTLASNPFASENPALPSPTSRFQVVSRAIRYTCNTTAHTLTRQSGYTWQSSVNTAVSGGTTALVANNVDSCSFHTTVLQNNRSALVALTVSLRNTTTDDPAVTLTDQVHVNNTP